MYPENFDSYEGNMLEEGKPNPILDKTFQFAINTVNLYKKLIERREFVMSKQLLRSGTSVGANVREARNAESKADFIHKMAIAQKESDEVIYWADLLFATQYIDQEEHSLFTGSGNQIHKIIRTIILNTKKNLQQ